VNEPNTYGTIGGKVDDNTISLKAEANREFHEETGYRGMINLIPAYVFKDKDFEYHNFIGLVPEEFQPTSNCETQEFKWVDLNELLKIQPKHFGLSALINHSISLIKRYAN
jgi:8-oxo-dGTP pyrophosphatase MutT (NUDIX family)